MKPIYQLRDLGLAYDGKTILRDLNFQIEEGAFVGLLGPNGCGKTTLLNLLAGVLRPTWGDILLADKNLKDYSRRETAKIVSVLPQETFVDFPFSALEVVLMGRAPYLRRFQWESPGDLEIAREAMRATDCLAFADRDIRLLSGGERERVLLARALAQQPKVLLLDEPTNHLDLQHQSEIYALLKRLHREQGLTLLVVLHDLNFAATACERILLLSDGGLAADGAPAEVLSAETIREIFGAEVSTGTDPRTGKPFFLPYLP